MSAWDSTLRLLQQRGWTVQRATEAWTIPADILERYGWAPASIWEFMTIWTQAAAPDDQSWFITGADLNGATDSAYSWNEWERQSLEAAGDDSDWCDSIRTFWDDHLPLLLCVRGGYSYLALDRRGLRVVAGDEPEFEEAVEVAASWDDFLAMLEHSDSALSRWA